MIDILIIDKTKIYLLGTSINSIGNNTTTIVKLEDESIKKVILNDVISILK